MLIMKYLIYQSFAAASDPVVAFDTEKEVANFIVSEADRLIYCLYRWWSIDNVDYYYVGPRIYAVHKIN